jgi:hemerythrin
MSTDKAFFKWSPKYSVNIKIIDDQHRELVNILNRLCNAVTRREGNKAIAVILDSLMSYTQTHFRLEESLMQQAKFSDYEAHKLEHTKLIEQLDLLCTKHLFQETPIYFEMLRFLKTWLNGHLLGEVGKYSAALQQSGFSVSAWEKEISAEFALTSNAKRQWWRFWKVA